LKLIASLTVLAALAIPAVATADPPGKQYKTYAVQKSQRSVAQQCPGIHKGVRYYRRVTWKFQNKLDATITRAALSEFPSCNYAKWAAELWRDRSSQWNKRWVHYLKNRPTIKYLSQWICIHNHEGAWNANTGNGYYGGLQMDITFQNAYGRDMIRKYGGYAHTWSPRDQMIVAERAHDSGRGFGPWPNTGRMCGVL
jgi:Transglycosylase-like domain